MSLYLSSVTSVKSWAVNALFSKELGYFYRLNFAATIAVKITQWSKASSSCLMPHHSVFNISKSALQTHKCQILMFLSCFFFTAKRSNCSQHYRAFNPHFFSGLCGRWTTLLISHKVSVSAMHFKFGLPMHTRRCLYGLIWFIIH